MPDTKASAFTLTTALTDDDTIPVIDDQDGTPLNRQITWANFKTALNTGVAVTRSTTQTISTGSAAAISFDTEVRDDGGFWVVGTPTRLTVPSGHAGWYSIAGWLTFSNEATGERQAQILVNGGSVGTNHNLATAAYFVHMPVSAVAYLIATDYVQLAAYHDRGSDATVLAGARLAMTRF